MSNLAMIVLIATLGFIFVGCSNAPVRGHDRREDFLTEESKLRIIDINHIDKSRGLNHEPMIDEMEILRQIAVLDRAREHASEAKSTNARESVIQSIDREILRLRKILSRVH